MYAPPVASQLHGMFQMQHLVIHDVFDCTPWHGGMVEDATYHDGVMSRVVVAKTIAGMIATPSHLRPGQESIEEARVQVVENFLEIVGVATCRLDAFAAAYLPHQVSFLGNVVTGNISAVTAWGVLVHWAAMTPCPPAMLQCSHG